MKPFRRTAHIHARTQPVSWAAELVELAALFMAVGVAHLFVSLIGHHADGATMLVISGAALIVGAAVNRWWGIRTWRVAAPVQARSTPDLRDLLEMPSADRKMWQVRAILRDRPGSLAALSGKLAALEVNILAIQAHPTKNGVADELLVAAPPGVTVKEIAAAVDAGGGADIVVAAADAHDLVDPPTRALGAAVRAASDPRFLADALAELLRATVVREPAGGGASDADAGTARFRDHTGTPITLSRPGLPFTPAELSRGEALIDLCGHLGPRSTVVC